MVTQCYYKWVLMPLEMARELSKKELSVVKKIEEKAVVAEPEAVEATEPQPEAVTLENTPENRKMLREKLIEAGVKVAWNPCVNTLTQMCNIHNITI